MRSLESWLNEYGESHQNPKNQYIHKICVPLIMMATLGLFWAIPTPVATENLWINWSTLFALLCLVFYWTLSPLYFLGMALSLIPTFALIYFLHQKDLVLEVSLAVFVIAWIFQFVGHKIEGKKPSFAKDLLFLLIGPLWVLKSVYAKIGLHRSQPGI